MAASPWQDWRVVADLHTHTVHSHGTGTVLANATVAASRGLETVGITEHGPQAIPWVAVDSAATYEQIRVEARAAEKATGVRVLVGAECNVMNPAGDLDMTGPDLARLDLVLAGLHLLIWPADPRGLPGAARLVLPNLRPLRLFRRVRARARATNTKALTEAVRRYHIDIVTHPGLHLPVDTPELARACAARGTRMEISSRHHQTDEAYVRAAAREGVDFVFSSDAHRPSQVGDLARCLRVAERAELAPERVWNVAAAPAKLSREGPLKPPPK